MLLAFINLLTLHFTKLTHTLWSLHLCYVYKGGPEKKIFDNAPLEIFLEPIYGNNFEL